MKEIWVDIKDFEGLYQVSNWGRVKSLKRTIIRRNGNKYTVKEKILKACIDSTGHLQVDLRKNGVKERYSIHKLVAQHFIPNSDNKPIIHHKDHNKENNYVENLVWLTKPEHADEHPEVYETCGKAARKACSKHINQFTKDGLFLRAWYSSMDIERELGYSNGSIIKCCQGKPHHNSAYGYIWEYA